MVILVILYVSEVFWSSFRFRGYFGYFLGFEGILVISWILGVFWSFLGFEGIFVIFWISRDILVIFLGFGDI